MKKWTYVVLAVHSSIVLFVLWCDLTAKGENWSWVLTIPMDFPVSVAILAGLDFVSDRSTTYVLLKFAAHLIVGGAWWGLIVFSIAKLSARIRARYS